MHVRNAIQVASMVITVCAACFAQGPAAVDRGKDVELAAARHILQLYPSAVVVIDSMYAGAEQAPGYPSGQVRPPSRTTALVVGLRATVGASAPDGGVYLILSQPVVSAESARVTVTAQWKGGPGWRRGRSGYHTQALVLVREAGAWRVAEVRDLGTS